MITVPEAPRDGGGGELILRDIATQRVRVRLVRECGDVQSTQDGAAPSNLSIPMSELLVETEWLG